MTDIKKNILDDEALETISGGAARSAETDPADYSKAEEITVYYPESPDVFTADITVI